MNAFPPSDPPPGQAFWQPQWDLDRLGVRMHLSFRQGGVSKAPYESLNLGSHVGDDPKDVEKNRMLYQERIRAKPVFFDQVHGAQCLQIDATSENGMKADAAYTLDKGVACTMMVADCMPLLLADSRARLVAAVHVGWRGLVGIDSSGKLLPHGVITNCVNLLTQTLQIQWGESPTPQAGLLAWLGPCISASAFEVGPEVAQAFAQRDPLSQSFFYPHPHLRGKWMADLPKLVRQELLSLGVTQLWGNDGSPQWCTVGRPDLYFSHRRDQKTGRFAASIWLE